MRQLSAAAFLACALTLPLGAQQPERADTQRPDLPPPYYDSHLGPATTEHRTLTIDEAIHLALEQASTYQLARLDEAAAAEELRQAKAARFPALSVPLTYVATTPASGVSPEIPAYAAANGVHEALAFVSATGTLDLAGKLRAQLAHSRDLLAAARAGTDAARRDLVLATIDAYYGLSLARQRRRLGDETLALAESFAELTREMAASGKAEPAESLRAASEALRRRDELEQARVSEAASSEVLRTLLGLPSSLHIGVSRPDTVLPSLDSFDTYSEDSILGRPELARVQALEASARADVDAARADRRPQVTYALNGGFDATDFGRLREFSGASALVTLTVPVFDFGGARSRAAEAELRVRSLEQQREAIARQLRQDLFTQRATAFAAVRRMHESKDRAASAEKSLDALLARYRERQATLNEVLDSQSAYADARAAYYQAIADFASARARLEADPSRVSFASATSGAVAEPTSPVDCHVPLGAAPEIAGLRLGMTADAARERVPGLDVAGPDAAVDVDAQIPAPDDPAFAVTHASLRFAQGRLVSARLLFSPDTVWETKDALLAAAANRFHLPGPWKAFYDWKRKTLDDAEDLRDVAVECDGFRLRLGLGYFSEGLRRTLTPHIKMEETGE